MYDNPDFAERWKRLQQDMAGNGTDVLIALSNDKAVFGPGNVRYLSDFPTHFEDAMVILPAVGEPVLGVGPETPEYARLHSAIWDIRVIEEFAIPGEDYPYTKMESLSSILKWMSANMGGAINSIGFVGLDVVPWATFTKLQGVLPPSASWFDANNMLVSLRSVKSSTEIEIIRHGYSIADEALSACVDAIKVGVSEREVAAAGEAVMRARGAEGFAIDPIVASGSEHTHPIVVRPTDRKIKNDELVLVTIGPRFRGYNPAIGRPVVVGSVSDDIEFALQVALDAQHEAEKALRPGVSGADVELPARRLLDQKGLGEYFVYSGVHSVGMAEFEPPILSQYSTQLVQENMVFSIDIPLFLAPWGGFRFEDGFVVTADGSARLNSAPREVIRK